MALYYLGVSRIAGRDRYDEAIGAFERFHRT